MNPLQIYRDESLYGHSLLTLPPKIWSFSTARFSLYHPPDPGTLVVDRDYMIARSVFYRSTEGNVQRYTMKTEFFIERPLCNLIEFIGRRILGPCAAVVSSLIAVPIGFAAKVIHLSAREVTAYVTQTAPVQKIRQVWNDSTLFGHALTSAPSKCYKIASAPLSWHLRADGTDRRSFIARFSPQGQTVQESEYALLPFECFEFFCRRVICGTATVALAAISPVGLMAKAIHLTSRSHFLNERIA